MRGLLLSLRWLLLLAAIVDWVALRTGRAEHPPGVLALLVGAAILAQLLALLVLARKAWRGGVPRVRFLAEALLAGGLAVALAAGSANWALGLQGFVVLHEGEAVPLHGGSHLQHFEGGPLSRIGEMEVVLALEELELIPGRGGGFYPRSHVRVERRGEPPVRLRLDPTTSAASGTLRFHQGAFGFAPRIVVRREEEVVFDRVVPFTSERRGLTGIAFEGAFAIEREGLELDGRVDLSSLDEGMRGHATLALAARRRGTPLGRGRLMPGHFADIEQGYSIGFAGLERWSEVDLSRRDYGAVVLLGAGMAAVGGALWPLARWRGW